MNRLTLDSLTSWRPGDNVVFWGLLLGAALMLVLAWRVLRRRRSTRGYDARADQFAPTAPIDETQIQLLHYLQRAFPDGAVLFRPRLARFLAVRKARQRLAAQQRLAADQVDFLICGNDGKPLFAFEVDAFKPADDRHVERLAAEKNLMLKSAGIRLIRLKGAQPAWPPPEALRMRLLAAQRAPVAAMPSQARPSGFEPSAFGPKSDFAPSRSATDTGTMSLTGLMGMQDDRDPWNAVRKR